MQKDMKLDDYFVRFGSKSFDDFQQELEKQHLETNWIRGIHKLAVEAMATPMDAQLRQYTSPGIPLETLLETAESSGLILIYDGGQEGCLRDCAIHSLLTTAGISGDGIKRASPENLAIGLTAFLAASREQNQLLYRAGKISAILSDQYEYMPAAELVNILLDLEPVFGCLEFRGAEMEHSYTCAVFHLPDKAQEVTDAYNNIVASSSRMVGEIIPCIKLRCSDTSNEAAKLLTYLKVGGVYLPLGGVNVSHIPPREYQDDGSRKTCLEKFQEEAELIFAKLGENLSQLIPQMLEVQLEYPSNVFVELCKWAKIPQKYGRLVWDEFRLEWPDHSGATMLEVYMALCRCTAESAKNGSGESIRQLRMEEAIAKIAQNRPIWKKFDLPGVVSWTGRPGE